MAGGFAGPPCETWSIARFQNIAGQKKAPRPVRDLANLWGRPDVGKHEGEQLEVGDALMAFALLALTKIALAGGLAVLEHPQSPHSLGAKHVTAPTIWRTQVVRWLHEIGKR